MVIQISDWGANMKQENKNKLWFCLLIIASTLVSILSNLITPLPNSSMSYIFGSILGRVIILIAIPLLIDRGVSFFKKKPLRWWLIWLVFLIIMCSDIINTILKIQQHSM